MNGPLWSARATQPGGPGLTVAAESTDTGLRLGFASDTGASVGLTFDRTEVYQLRDACNAHLADLAQQACPGPEHLPVQRQDRRPAWCVHCGCTADGTQVADLSWLRQP